MTELFTKYKKIIIGVLSLALVVVGYFVWQSVGSTDPSLVYSTENSTVIDQGIGQSVLVALERLRRIKIDTDFFLSPSFRSLVDLSTATTTEEVGRPDPFVPIDSKKSGIVPVVQKKK